MAFTTPATAVALTALTAGWLNTYVRDNIAWIATDSPACRAYRSTNATVVAITLDSERFDNATFHSTSSNTARFTVPTGGGGKYLIGAGLEWQNNVTGERALFLRIAGATDVAQNRTVAGSTGEWSSTIMTVWAFLATEYFEATAYQTSTISINVNSTNSRSPEVSAFWFRT